MNKTAYIAQNDGRACWVAFDQDDKEASTIFTSMPLSLEVQAMMENWRKGKLSLDSLNFLINEISPE